MPGSAAGRGVLARDLLGLAGFVGACLAVSALGGAITATSVGGWYQQLQKPSFNPPDWLFAPVWTTLYLLMAIAAWRVWRRLGWHAGRQALAVFTVQLILNLLWSGLFFGWQAIGLALFEILLLLGAIVTTAILFWRIDPMAGLLFVPYAAWVAFATLLNAAFWALN